MRPDDRPVSAEDDLEQAIRGRLASVNAVLTLSLILSQASSPAQAMGLVTTAVPSIAPGLKAFAWHPTKNGDYYQRAPDHVSAALARLTGHSRIELNGDSVCWAFPAMAPLDRERIFLVAVGDESPSDEAQFLLSVLAQHCGTVISKLELIDAQHESAENAAALNAELRSTVSALERVMEIHHRLNESAADAGVAGIAAALHQLSGLPVLIRDANGDVRAVAGEVSAEDLAEFDAAVRGAPISELRTARRAIYHGNSWSVLVEPGADVLVIIELIDPVRRASEIDLAALEYAASALSVELGRLRSVAEAELRSEAVRDRDVAQARAAELAASEARQAAILEVAHDAVISVDRDGKVSYTNSAFVKIFGYSADEAFGRELAEMVIPPPLREAHRQALSRCVTTGESRILGRLVEMTAMRADGSEFPAEVTITRTGLPGEPRFTGYIRDITERHRSQQELAASRARLVAASDAARQRITRDLHDGVQQRLVTTLINLQLADRKWESAPQRARELLRSAIGDAGHGIEDLREIAAGIHPAILTHHGLAAAVDALVGRLPLAVDLDVPDRRLPPPVEASVYFFCSEALTNVVKHSRASAAWVRVEHTAAGCAVEVGDDGIGGAQPRSEAGGLRGLRDRIGALNGTMQVTSPAHGGTVLRAAVPIPATSNAAYTQISDT